MKNRWIAAALIAITLAALLLWQRQRTSLAGVCVRDGHVWNGASSTCDPAPKVRPVIIQRDLQRS